MDKGKGGKGEGAPAPNEYDDDDAMHSNVRYLHVAEL